jgi:hypothetical protein
LPHEPELGGLQFETDNEEQQDHAEFGDREDLLAADISG